MTRQPNRAHRLRFQLIAATFARMVINTAHRMIYPFLPAFSRGLGVPVDALTAIISTRGALGIASPLFGPIPDRLGRRNAMFIGVAVFCAGLALVALVPSYITLFTAMILIVVAKFIFDPALQAYVGDRTPYARRSMAIGLTELSWSGAVLVGTPAVGLFIANGGWRAPFWPMAAFGLLAGLGLWYFIPAAANAAPHAAAPTVRRWAAVARDRPALGALTVGLLISAANESISVIYGLWLEKSFALSVVQLGLTTAVIGVAELAGEGLVMTVADRLGKRRAIAIGLAVSTLAYLALPLVSSQVQRALGGIFFVYIAFEFTIVANIPLITEIMPEARGTLMSTNIAFHAAGRMIGALLGGYLFHAGFVWNGIAAAGLNLASIPLILWVVKERS